MIRINSGRLKGKKFLPLPKDFKARPTLSKTRSAIFDSLQSRWDINSFYVYDLFAGSGTLGIEAYSLGAEHIFFVDKDKKSFAFLKKNLNYLGISEACKCYHADTLEWSKTHQWTNKPKLLLLDPPYNSPVLQEFLIFLATGRVPLNNSVLLIERPIKSELVYPDELQLFKQKRFGLTQIDFLEFKQRQ